MNRRKKVPSILDAFFIKKINKKDKGFCKRCGFALLLTRQIQNWTWTRKKKNWCLSDERKRKNEQKNFYSLVFVVITNDGRGFYDGWRYLSIISIMWNRRDSVCRRETERNFNFPSHHAQNVKREKGKEMTDGRSLVAAFEKKNLGSSQRVVNETTGVVPFCMSRTPTN